MPVQIDTKNQCSLYMYIVYCMQKQQAGNIYI